MIQRRITSSGQVRYDVRLRRPDGSNYAKTFHTKKEAERYKVTQLADRARGDWIDPQAGQITFDAWADEWYLTMSNTWRPRTAEKHLGALRGHWRPRFGGLVLSSITPRQVQAAVNELASTHRPGSVRTYFGTLRALFRSAVDQDVLGRSPCRGIKLPTDAPGEKRVVTPAQLHRLADETGPAWRSLIYMAGVVGLRFGEAAALRVSDVDLSDGLVSVHRTLVENNGQLSIGAPKTTAGTRTLVMPLQLVNELRDHIDLIGLSSPKELMFADRFGGPIRRSNFRRNVFDPAAQRAGLHGMTFHGLRHSAATQWVADGIDVRTVQHRLGHADPRLVLKLYAHASSDADSAAAEVTARSYWPNDAAE